MVDTRPDPSGTYRVCLVRTYFEIMFGFGSDFSFQWKCKSNSNNNCACVTQTQCFSLKLCQSQVQFRYKNRMTVGYRPGLVTGLLDSFGFILKYAVRAARWSCWPKWSSSSLSFHFNWGLVLVTRNNCLLSFPRWLLNSETCLDRLWLLANFSVNISMSILFYEPVSKRLEFEINVKLKVKLKVSN